MISSLIAALRRIQLEPTAEEIADALWLAIQMGQLGHVQEQQQRSGGEPLSVEQTTAPSSLETDRSTKHPDLMIPNALDEPSSGIYTQNHGRSLARAGSGLPFRTPAAFALPGSLELSRALRSLMRHVPSRLTVVFDEESTVHRIAEEHIWMPVLKPAPERRFEVALVIDESASMLIWRQTVIELRTLLERHGAFRDVRTWRLVTNNRNDKTQVRLYSGSGRIGEASRAHNPGELADPARRRLILVVTDCISRAWYSGTMAQLLRTWGRTNSLAIIQVLPQRLWSQCALGTARMVRIHASSIGGPNTQLGFKLLRPWQGKQFLSGFPFPVTTLESVPLAAWARLVTGEGDISVPGFILPEGISEKDENEQKRGAEPPEQLVQKFQAVASSTAVELAGLFAAAPLTLPVMRLVQQTLLPDSRQVHFAEVFLSGLIKQVFPSTVTSDPDTIHYDFVEGIRDILLDSVSIPDAVQVLKAVSSTIEARLGQTLDFEAILANPTSTDGIEIDEQSRPFATVAKRILRRLGGPYAQLAERLDPQQSSVGTVLRHDPRRDLKVELLTKHVWNMGQVEIRLALTNISQWWLENIRVRLLDSIDYDVIERNFFTIRTMYLQQNVKSEFIIRPRTISADLNLSFEIIYDDTEHKQKSFMFTDLLELRSSLQEFRYIPNPYSTGTPTLDSKMFYGREADMAFLIENLTRNAKSVIVLYGQRRSGKTTLLLHLINTVVSDEYILVLIDMHRVSYRITVQSFLYKTASYIAQAMKKNHLTVHQPKMADFEIDPTHAFDLFLDSIEKQFAKRRLILMIDEFEVLEEQVMQGRLQAEIFEYLRDILQHRQSINFLFSGTHKITEYTKWYRAVFFNIARHHRLSRLNPQGTEDLIQRPVAGYLEYEPLTVKMIHQLTADQPYLIHLICRAVVDYCNDRHKVYVTINDIDTIVREVMETGQYHFDWLWDQISPEERVVLSAIAEGGKEEGRPLTLDEVIEQFQHAHIPFRREHILDSLRTLIDADFIENVFSNSRDLKSSLFRIPVGLFREWLRKGKPLEFLRKE